MSSKKDFVKNLNNVKLVIGNGFDLRCGLKSKYSDFFAYLFDKDEKIEEWYKEFATKVRYYLDFSTSNYSDFWISYKCFNLRNVWDFFFYFLSKNKSSLNKNWCDIEYEIEESLHTPDPYKILDISWEKVCRFLTKGKKTESINIHEELLCAIIHFKNNKKLFLNKNDFYSFLLIELKNFETNFSNFIYNQQYTTRTGYGICGENELFIKLSLSTLNELVDFKNLSSVDSFNFGPTKVKWADKVLHNINGSFNSPIFGIDSIVFKPNAPQYIFSKVCRRMENEMNKEFAETRKEFENIVIYGHSLNKADHNYFFGIFDLINVLDLNKSNVIVFAYSIYDENQKEDIKLNLRLTISNLICEYAISKGMSSPNRLLDSLTASGKIIMYEIPNIII